MKKNVLIIDDEQEMRNLLENLLEKNGFSTVPAEDANEAFEIIKVSPPDLILLDIKLPDINGFRFCEFLKKEQKARDIPVIMLTGMDTTAAKVNGLDLGADDYITKPFDNRELIARINALSRKNVRKEMKEGLLSAGSLSLDPAGHCAWNGREKISLSPKEFDILHLLIKNKNRLLTRETIIENIWGDDYTGSARTVDVHIRYIRRKLKQHADKIVTIDRAGYKFTCPT